MYNINGYRTQTKIEKSYRSKEFRILGPSLNLIINFNENKIIRSKEKGFDSEGNKIIRLFEVLDTDSKNRPIRAKSYQYYENIEEFSSKNLENKDKNEVLVEDKSGVLDYSFENSIEFSKGLNENTENKGTESYDFTIYEFKKEHREAVKTIHEYTYYNNLYVQKDIPTGGSSNNKDKNSMMINEVAVEVSNSGQKISEMFKEPTSGQKISEMFKEPTSGAIAVKLENTYDQNNRLIYTKKLNGHNMRYQYYENGLLKKITQEGILGTINYILQYEYSKIDQCGNPVVQRINYVVPSIRDDNKKVPSYCPNMKRQFSYKYYEAC